MRQEESTKSVSEETMTYKEYSDLMRRVLKGEEPSIWGLSIKNVYETYLVVEITRRY